MGSVTIDYTFEEVQPYPGFCVLVSGTAEIVGTYDAADPDVGIMRGGWEYYISSIKIDRFGNPDESATMVIDDTHPLWEGIEAELQGRRYSDLIDEELSSAAEPDPDYHR